jgi:hypothetical protein
VCLSTLQASSTLDAKSPILGLVARDLDGDPRDQVIAGAVFAPAANQRLSIEAIR